MPTLNIRSRTLTNPDVIPEAGASVTFTVEARASVQPVEARFIFRLDAADGYRWANGSTATSETSTLTRQWATQDFQLRIEQSTETGAVLLRIDVEAVLVDGSDAQPSVARLTVMRSLAAHLVTHREAEKMTQADLAEKVGVSPSWISDLEHGANPSIEVFDSIKGVIE